MKLFKLTAVAAAVLGSSVAMAQDVVVVDNTQAANDVVVVDNTQAANDVVVVTEAPVQQTGTNVLDSGKGFFNQAVNPAAVSAEIGTLGYGANIAWGVNETTELQAGWSGMDFDGDKNLDSNDSWLNYGKILGDGYSNYEGKLKYDFDFSNPYVGVQMRPWANNFTVGTGVMVPRNKLKASLTADENSKGQATVSIDDVDYQVDSAKIKAENRNTLAPYLTIGYRPNINQNWGGFFEAGAAYMGKLEAQVTDVEGTKTDGFAEAAKKEIEKDDVWYPIVKAGVTYRF